MPRHGGTTCLVPKCIENTKEKKVSFFSFPSESERCKMWIKNIGRKDLLNEHKHSIVIMKVCAKHFESIMFLNDLRNRLHKHALPTLCLVNQYTGND